MKTTDELLEIMRKKRKFRVPDPRKYTFQDISEGWVDYVNP